MNIVREAFLGGERYYCSHCGITVEKNIYPENHVGSSAKSLLKRDPETAAKEGIHFSGFVACNCEDPED